MLGDHCGRRKSMANARLFNNLTMAETQQLGFEVYAEEDVAAEIRRFYGMHIDQIESFQAAMTEQLGLIEAQAERRSTYDKLHRWSREVNPDNREDEILITANNAAGGAVWTANQEVRKSHDKVIEQGTELSVAAVDYFHERLPEVDELLIFGRRYGLSFPVISRKVGKHVMIFAGGEHFVDASRKITETSGAKSSAKHPTLQDWETWLQGMGKVALF